MSVYESGELPVGEVALLGGVQKTPYAYILQPRHPGVKFLKITDSSLSTKKYGQNDMFWLLMLFYFLPDIYLCGEQASFTAVIAPSLPVFKSTAKTYLLTLTT